MSATSSAASHPTWRPRIIFVTQLVDPSDAVLGFTVRWIRALAAQCDEVRVVANEVRNPPQDLDVEVYSLGKEAGASRLTRLFRYRRLIRELAREMSADGMLAHMCPIYLVASAFSLSRLRRLLWYAHPADSYTLRLADLLADHVVTSLPGAYPLTSSKVRVIGQATDVETFSFAPKEQIGTPIRLLALGRTSPLKGYVTVVRAVEILRSRGVDSHLTIVGSATTEAETRHRLELDALIRSLGICERVELLEGVSPATVPALLREADCVVNAMASGSGDKVVFEALSSGTPVLASNPAFDTLLSDIPLELRFREGDHLDLADRVSALAAAAPETRIQTLYTLRNRVEREHSLESWTNAIVELLDVSPVARRA